MTSTFSRAAAVAASGVLAIGLLGACSSDSGSSSTSSASAGASGAASGDAAKALQTAYTGATGTPPTDASGAPKPGVNVWVISCGEQVPSCATPVKGIVEAAKAAGWNAKTCDGQLNPGGWGNCIRQGVTAKVDVIFPVGIDCASVKAPFEEAKKAGVKTIGAGGADCDATGGEKLWESERLQLKDTSIKDYWKLNGKLQADWLIGKTDGKAQVLQVNFTDPLWGPWIKEGFEEELKTCSGCKTVATLDISNNDMASGQLAQKFSSALLANPGVDAVTVPVGGWMQAGLSQAIQSSGRAAKLHVASGFGDASTFDLMRSAQFDFGALGYATEWGSYGSVDTAIRILNGQKAVVEGDGFQMVDKTTNMPASGDYTGDVDFKSAYTKLWGKA
ncbi:sugar ABC transporter substrate-binding protein [Actinomycetota bacterium]